MPFVLYHPLAQLSTPATFQWESRRGAKLYCSIREREFSYGTAKSKSLRVILQKKCMSKTLKISEQVPQEDFYYFAPVSNWSKN